MVFCHADVVQAILKEIDEQGRIVIPAEWRKKWLRRNKVILRRRGEVLEILPYKEVDLTAFFDRAEVDIKTDLSLSTVHFAEIANLLEDWMALSEARTILFALATMENIRILPVARTDLVGALDLATERDVGTTDALAVILMQTEVTREIYSFDRDYDRFNEIRRVDA